MRGKKDLYIDGRIIVFVAEILGYNIIIALFKINLMFLIVTNEVHTMIILIFYLGKMVTAKFKLVTSFLIYFIITLDTRTKV